MFCRRQVSLRPVQVRYRRQQKSRRVEVELLTYKLLLRLLFDSLQLGLATYLDVPVHLVYENFEEVGMLTCRFACVALTKFVQCRNAVITATNC